MKILSSALLLSSMLIGTSYAQISLNDVHLGKPGHAGSGCPIGTVSTTLSPDKKSLSILFDDYMVEAGPSTRKRMARKNCQLAVPVHVPNGLSVSLIGVDYRGYNFLPSRSEATFTAEYFFAGRRGPRYMKKFFGGLDSEYTLSNTLALVSESWSKCGEDVNLRIATAMRVRNLNRVEDSLSTVDSVDMNAGIVYKLQYRKCRKVIEEELEEEELWGEF